MNKISKYGTVVNEGQFKYFIKDIFDDCFDIEEYFQQHSECRVQIGAHVDLDYAKVITQDFGLSIPPESLVGTWMLEASRDYNNGLYWDEVSEIVKVVETTETITVTKWKPICDENVQPCSKE